MNARTQITLDPELQRRAHAKAAELGISFAEYVRRLLANDLGKPRPRVDISAVFDLGASAEPTDIARDKHKLLDQAAWDEHTRETGGKGPRSVRAKTRRR